MKLLTKKLERRFAKVGRQECVEDPIVICKFFNPVGAATWFATEYDPETRMFFGWADIFGNPTTAELGYFSLDEFEQTRIPLKIGSCVVGYMGIERDLYFDEMPLSQAKEMFCARFKRG